MKRNRFIYVAAALAATVVSAVSCGKTEGENPGVEGDCLRLLLSSIDWEGNPASFNDGEIAGVYASSAATVSDGTFLENALFSKSGNFFESSAAVELPESGIVRAYMPYSSAGPVTDGNTGTVSVHADQGTSEDYYKSDFVLGGADFVKSASGVSELVVDMKKMFSNVKISIRPQDAGAADFSLASLSFHMDTEAVIDFDACSVVSTGAPADIVPNGSLEASDGKYSGIRFVAVPQTISADAECIKISLGDEETVLTFGRELVLKSGMQYNIELLIDNVGTDWSLEFTVVEEPWGFGDELDEEVGIDTDEITSVTDIEGNEYPVVRIGKYYWMASNLITTKYNDGSDISFLASESEWQLATYSGEGGYAYYQLNDSNIAKYGMYYNWYAVDTGRLCPEGWRIPSKEDYEEMIRVLGGAQAALVAMKSVSGWKDTDFQELPQYQGTNSSGFNVVPAGYRLDGGAFKNQQEFGYLWTSTRANEYRSISVVLAALNQEVLTDAEFHRAIGMAVRCVKY